MKKILILTYFFPPSNFAGSFRAKAFAKYLHEHGYHPIVVTRNWDEDSLRYKDMSRSTIKDVIHEVKDNYEVYYLPYKGNLRDRIYNKYGDSKRVTFRKLLSFFEIVLQNFTNSVLPFKNIYTFSKNLIKEDNDIKYILATGKPYILYKFCYQLHKKFKINWIADYRYPWTANEFINKYYPFIKSRYYLERYFEKKWLKTALFFTTVSEKWTNIIGIVIKKHGYTIFNDHHV